MSDHCFTGTCKFGPYNGQIVTRWERTFSVYRPALEFNLAKATDDLKVEPALVGTYEWSDGLWLWNGVIS